MATATSRFLRLFSRLSGGVVCPKCQRKQPDPGNTEVIECRSCHYSFSISEAVATNTGSPQHPPVDPDQPPSGTKIVRLTPAPGIIGWQVPRSGKGGGLLFFAIAWLAFIAIFTTMTLLPNSDDPGASLFMTLFTIPFWAVGIGLLYAALRAKYATHFIAVDDQAVRMSRVFFGRTSRKTLSRQTLTSAAVQVFHTQNYQPVYGVEVRGSDGKIRFGTTLTEAEKHWLVADLKRTIWPERKALEPSSPVETVRTPTPNFTVDFPPAPLLTMLGGSLIGAVVVIGFLAIGIFLLGDSGFFRWLWLGLNSLFAVLIAWGIKSAVVNSQRTIRVIGGRSEIRVQEIRYDRMVSEKTLVRTPDTVARKFPAHQQDPSRVNVELLGDDQVLRVVTAYPDTCASEPFDRLADALT